MSDDQKDPRELAEEARKWVASAEGKKALENALGRAKEDIEKLKNARRVDPEELERPITM
jgi:hypothetical protein